MINNDQDVLVNARKPSNTTIRKLSQKVRSLQSTSMLRSILYVLLAMAVAVALIMSIIGVSARATTTGTKIATINGVGPNANTGDFLIGGDTGISVIVSGPNSITIQNDMTLSLVEPSEFIVAGSPIDGTGGTITVTKATQAANRVWAGPTSGPAAQPTFRALVDADIPNALSLTMLTVSGDTLLGANTSCVMPLLPSCYDISGQQCVGGPLAGNCLPPSAAFDNLIVGTLTILNGTSNNGTVLNNTLLGDTFLNGTLSCVGSGSISSSCLNLGGYTCPMGMPLAESCIPASLVQYDMSVTNNLTVNMVTCAGSPLPSNCIPSLDASTITSGILPISVGGTGSATPLNNNRIMVSSAGAIVESGPLTNGQVLIGSTGLAPVVASLTAGSGITITNGAGSITIAASGSMVIMDNLASGFQFPTSPQTEGVWYGPGAKAGCNASDAIAFGINPLAASSGTIAIGVGATALVGKSVAIGTSAYAIDRAVAIGWGATANQPVGGSSFAMGWMSLSTGGVAIGSFATAVLNNQAIAIGGLSYATAGAISIGGASDAVVRGIAIGNTCSSAEESIAIGYSAQSNGYRAVTIGYLSGVSGLSLISVNYSVTIGASVFTSVSGGPVDAAHAFAININNATVNPGSLGMTVNNAPYQLPLYTSLFTTTVTTGGTTTLTSTSAKSQRFSGTLTQTVVLPVVTTLANGFEFEVINDSTGTVTVQTSGTNTLALLTTGSSGWAKVVNTAGGAGTASWHFTYGAPSAPATSVVLDNLATPTTYPMSPQTEGIWYGPGSKAGCGTSTSIAIGRNPVASLDHSIAIGTNSISGNSYGIAIGVNASATGPVLSLLDGIAIGRNALAESFGTSVGTLTYTVDGGIAIGGMATTNGDGSVGSVSVGLLSISEHVSTAIGLFATAKNFSLAIGYNANATKNSIAIGFASHSNDIDYSITLGSWQNSNTQLNRPENAAHAFAIALNTASVNPGTLGITVNNAPYQLPLYTADYATTVTTGGTTTLLVTSAQKQRFSGTLTQTVVLPVVTTLANGFTFELVNDATSTVTVQTSGAAVLATLTAGASGSAMVVNTAGGTGVASWHFSYGSSLTAGPIVLDNLASPTYPTAPQTQGIWYGPGSKAGCGTSTSIAIGNNPSAVTSGTIAIGITSRATNSHDVAIGTNASASGFISISSVSVGYGANASMSSTSFGSFSASNFFATSNGYLATSSNGGVAIGSLTLSFDDSVSVGTFSTSRNLSVSIGTNSIATDESIAIGRFASSLGIVNSVTLGASLYDSEVGPQDAAHAFALNINNATVNPGTLGITVNNLTYQLPLYAADYETTVTTGGTTTLTVRSAQNQRFSGTLTQTVVLPIVTTLANGFQFEIINDSTGTVTVQTSGANTLATLTTGLSGWAKVVDTTGGTGVASWHFTYGSSSAVVLDNLASGSQFPTAPQTQGVWYGPGAKAGCAANTNIAIGLNPIANATNTIAIGNGPQCTYDFDVAIGFMSTSNINSISIGPLSIATNGSIAIGIANDANLGGIAIGNLATANGLGSIAIGGLLTNSNGDYSVALGGYADSSEYSVSVGSFALAGYHSVSIGGFAGGVANVDYSVSIGASVFGYPIRSGALDTAHAFALNINNATVNPGTLGITVNNAPYQLPLYTSDFATTPTAAAVTALSVTSAKKQFFTGTTTQTVVLPDVSTLAAGFEFKISNLSTGAVTVDVFGGGGTVATLAGTTAPTTKWGYFTCINVAGVGTAGWAYDPGA